MATKKSAKAEKVIDAYRKVFSTPEGEVVLKDLLNITGFRRPSIGETPYDTYYNEGARSISLRILETIDMPHEVIRKMIDSMRKEEMEIN